MIIVIDAPKSLFKTLSKLGIKRNLPIESIIVNRDTLEAFILKSKTRQEGPLSLFPFNNVLEILARAIRQEKET